MNENGKRQPHKKGGECMNAVLKLSDYTIDIRPNCAKKKKVQSSSDFFKENIDDIIELELNDTGIDEFLEKFSKNSKRKD